MVGFSGTKTPVRMGVSYGTQSGVGGNGPECVSGGTSAFMAAEEFNQPTVTGDIDFTIAGIGTPKAALLMSGAFGGKSHCVGAVTATDEKWFYMTHEEGATINAETELNTTQVLELKDNLGVVEARADFVQFITDGIRLNFSIADSFGGDVIIMFFGGDALCAKALTFSIDGNAVNNTVDVIDVGFNPEVVFTFMGTSGHTSLGTADDANFNFGIVHNDGTNPPPQYGFAYNSEDALTSQSLRSQHRLNSGYAIIAEDHAGSNLVAAQLVDFDVKGFTVKCTERTAWGTTLAGGLCLSWHGNAGLDLRVLDTQLSTGTWSQTDLGFQPTNLFAAANRSGAISDENIGTTDTDANSIDIGYSDGTDQCQSLIFGNDGGSGSGMIVTQTCGVGQALVKSNSTNVPAPRRWIVLLDSLDIGGYTLDQDDADTSNAYGFIVLAFASSV